MPYAGFDRPMRPSTEMPGWLDLLQDVSGRQRPTWESYMDKLGSVQKDILDQNPQGAYAAYSTLAGYNQGSAYQKWVGDQFNRYRGQYETMAAGDPALFWTDFLQRINPEADYKLTASPYERGEYRSGYSLAPTMRMTY